ncbi:MAG: hypothetical protein MK101_07720 [Phycisphaerales bacterium]|nr:hypothetical protein [Phycisphaerales bacterium]
MLRRGRPCSFLLAAAAFAVGGCDQSDRDGADQGTTPPGIAPPPPGAGSPTSPTDDQSLAGIIRSADAAASQTDEKLVIPRPAHGEPLLFLGMEAPLAPTWLWQPPRSSAWLAQWIVPGPADTEPAELVIFSPAESADDLVEHMLPVWSKQFRTGVIPAQPGHETRDVAGRKVHLVELAGEFTGMGGGWHRPDHRQITAVLDGPEHTVVIRLLGPQDTVEANRAAFMRMIEGIRRTP